EAWTRTPTPSPGFLAVLTSVSASSPTNALAVGWVQPQNADQPPVRTLALRWNGLTWTRVPSANPADVTVEATFEAVAFTSTGSARAVGEHDAGSLVEQWNGKRFALAKGSADHVDLFDIAGTSASNQWAIGQTDFENGSKTYVL